MSDTDAHVSTFDPLDSPPGSGQQKHETCHRDQDIHFEFFDHPNEDWIPMPPEGTSCGPVASCLEASEDPVLGRFQVLRARVQLRAREVDVLHGI